ncbi:MAG: nucleotidyltransferase family protein [Terracidiphilus sp.]
MPAVSGSPLADPPLASPPVDSRSGIEALACAICEAPTPRASARIASLARLVPDWQPFLALARKHRILPLACARLAASGASIPAEVQDQLRDAWQRNILHCTANAAELIQIHEALQRENIAALPFKGIVLAASAYNDFAARNAGDIDILVHLQDLLRATAILKARNFELLTPVCDDGSPLLTNSHEYHFERQSDGMVVELRWRLELTQPRYRRNVGMQWLWPHRQPIRIADIDLPGMDAETALLVLCMHGSKHTWARLVWISDVAHLLAAYPALDWSRVHRDARRLGLRNALALGVLLAHRICAAQIPAETLERFERNTTARRLAHALEEILFDHPGHFPAGRLPYNVQLLDTADRLRLLVSPDFFRPNERDLAFIRLPRSLHFLYLFLRPLRILRDKSAR